MSFTQHAQGSFSVEVFGPYHCGPNHDTPKQFTYEVELTYPADALDANGFLLDNTSFQQYFDSLGSTELSCEKLAQKAAHDIHAMTEGRCSTCTVGLWAIPNHAKIEYRIAPERAIAA